jgi:MraZ protein
VFNGEFEHTLDDKGRVILPGKFRARLEHLVVTKGRDGCLAVLPPDEFERVSASLTERGAAAREMQRFFIGGASEQSLDKQGRVVIPETLRRYAGLEREVTVLGVGPRLEIWDRAKWIAKQGEIDQNFAQLSEAHPDLPI